MKAVENPRRSVRRIPRGQALLEFAILVPVIIILIGATISFGLFFFQANVLQQAVDVAAQEISRMPFGPNQELGLGQLESCDESNFACNDQRFKDAIFDEQFLVIHDSEWDSSTEFNGDFRAFVDQLPLINRLIVPAMIRDNGMTRYPGTIVVNAASGEETVLIPIVEYSIRGFEDDLPFPNDNPPGSGFAPSSIRTAGETVIQWVAPLEEIRVDHDGDETSPSKGPFALDSAADATLGSFEPGMVALRINYPAQSTTLINRKTVSGSATEPSGETASMIVIAGDTVLDSGATTGCYMIQDPTPRLSPATNLPGSNANAGLYGLGELEAFTRIVRPYRKVMSFQAIYRREVFSSGT
ncbi:TadE/TadG family type IV pilus assembly protein [Roseiconus nitratireducens]|nr:TadE/TadG family type IV pilus assembly protein [Roseiconus nitratireducens]